ncbi:MAG TPA: hypothetical protein VHX86_14735 [Tepidisphaeraceae bacterium]|jgi:hypothetical protein|nr:hypothetical protein [Tepidisphaeraceae bacterium]
MSSIAPRQSNGGFPKGASPVFGHVREIVLDDCEDGSLISISPNKRPRFLEVAGTGVAGGVAKTVGEFPRIVDRDLNFKKICLCALLVQFCWAFLPFCDADPQTAAISRFQAEAPAGWHSLRTSLLPVAGSLTWVDIMDMPDPTEPGYIKGGIYNKEVRQFWLTDRAAKVISDRFDKSGKWMSRSVNCYNPDYAFYAMQYDRDGPYYLGMYGTTSDVHDRIRQHVENQLFPVEVSFIKGEALGNDATHIAFCRDVDVNGKHLVDVGLTYTPSGNEAKNASIRQDELFWDPAASWRLVRERLTTTELNAWTVVDYMSDQSELYYARKVVIQVNMQGRKAIDTNTFIVEPVLHPSLGPMEFRLPSIGLPELPPEGSRRFEHLTIIAANFLGIGVLLYIYYRKKGSKRTPKLDSNMGR